MLTLRPRFATVLVWFRLVVPRHSPHAVFLTNRDESEWIGMSVIPRFIPNAHEWPRLHLPHLKYESGAATVELCSMSRWRFPNHQDSSRITTVLSTTIHADVSMVLLPMHHDLINRG